MVDYTTSVFPILLKEIFFVASGFIRGQTGIDYSMFPENLLIAKNSLPKLHPLFATHKSKISFSLLSFHTDNSVGWVFFLSRLIIIAANPLEKSPV